MPPRRIGITRKTKDSGPTYLKCQKPKERVTIKCLQIQISQDIPKAKSRKELVILIRRSNYLIPLATRRHHIRKYGTIKGGKGRAIQARNELVLEICKEMKKRNYKPTPSCRSYYTF